jgi:hypothetical protein
MVWDAAHRDRIAPFFVPRGKRYLQLAGANDRVIEK